MLQHVEAVKLFDEDTRKRPAGRTITSSLSSVFGSRIASELAADSGTEQEPKQRTQSSKLLKTFRRLTKSSVTQESDAKSDIQKSEAINENVEGNNQDQKEIQQEELQDISLTNSGLTNYGLDLKSELSVEEDLQPSKQLNEYA